MAGKSFAETFLENLKPMGKEYLQDLFGCDLKNTFHDLDKKLGIGLRDLQSEAVNAFAIVSFWFGLVRHYVNRVRDFNKQTEKDEHNERLRKIAATLKKVSDKLDGIRQRLEELGKLLNEKILNPAYDTNENVYLLFDKKFDLILNSLNSCNDQLIDAKANIEKGFVSIQTYKANREASAEAGRQVVYASTGVASTVSAVGAATFLVSALECICTIGAIAGTGGIAAIGLLPLSGLVIVSSIHGREKKYAEDVQGKYEQCDEDWKKLTNDVTDLKRELKSYGSTKRNKVLTLEKQELKKKNELLEAQRLEFEEEKRQLREELAALQRLSLNKS